MTSNIPGTKRVSFGISAFPPVLASRKAWSAVGKKRMVRRAFAGMARFRFAADSIGVERSRPPKSASTGCVTLAANGRGSKLKSSRQTCCSSASDDGL
jgi:hypothetical protein